MTAQASPIPSAYELRMKQANVIRKFFNKMQRQAMAIAAHDEYIVASRGTGKSEGIDARFILRNVWQSPWKVVLYGQRHNGYFECIPIRRVLYR